jgi:hypothetical protein
LTGVNLEKPSPWTQNLRSPKTCNRDQYDLMQYFFKMQKIHDHKMA